MFMVKVTIKIQNLIESLSYLHFLMPLIFWQPNYVIDVLTTKPSTTKLAYTDSNTVTYSITRHTTGGGVGEL